MTLKSASPRDTPEINFNNFEDGTDAAGEDLEALLRGVKMARRLAAGGADGPAEGEISPGRECVSDDDLRQFIKNEAWGHHASCSNKMGPAERPDGRGGQHVPRARGKGLRVVDASVFPSHPGPVHRRADLHDRRKGKRRNPRGAAAYPSAMAERPKGRKLS